MKRIKKQIRFKYILIKGVAYLWVADFQVIIVGGLSFYFLSSAAAETVTIMHQTAADVAAMTTVAVAAD